MHKSRLTIKFFIYILIINTSVSIIFKIRNCQITIHYIIFHLLIWFSSFIKSYLHSNFFFIKRLSCSFYFLRQRAIKLIILCIDLFLHNLFSLLTTHIWGMKIIFVHFNTLIYFFLVILRSLIKIWNCSYSIVVS